MINPEKLVAMAKKWQKMMRIGRRRILVSKTSNVATEKGHFVVYSMDKTRFVVPIVYLSNNVFRELFRMSEEEFGIPRDGPITLSCDTSSLEYVVAIVEGIVSTEVEDAVIVALATR